MIVAGASVLIAHLDESDAHHDRAAALAFGADAATRLATLRAATSLKLPDCCVLLAAADDAGHGLR